MTTSDGSRVTIAWDSGSQRPTTAAMVSGGNDWINNYISGKAEGTTVAFTVGWVEASGHDFGDNAATGIYTDDFTGTINPDGQVSGTRLDSAGNSTAWVSDQRFTCTAQAAAPEPQPQPQPEPDAPPKIGSITATISNSSNLPGQCTYNATPDFNSHRDFSVPPNGSTPLTISGVNTGTTYHAVVVCNDSSGTQTESIGRAEADVTF